MEKKVVRLDMAEKIGQIVNLTFNREFNTSFSKYDIIVNFLQLQCGIENVRILQDECLIAVEDYTLYFGSNSIRLYKGTEIKDWWLFLERFALIVDGYYYLLEYGEGKATIYSSKNKQSFTFKTMLRGNQYLHSIERMIRQNLI